jgi:hypothetical protein
MFLLAPAADAAECPSVKKTKSVAGNELDLRGWTRHDVHAALVDLFQRVDSESKYKCASVITIEDYPIDGPRSMKDRLAWPISLTLKQELLRGAIELLDGAAGLKIVADQTALKKEGIDVNTPLSLTVENLSLRSTLNLLLKQAHLTYVIRDEVIVVTTEQNARGPLKQVSYAVADLVVPFQGRTAFLLEGTEEGKRFSTTTPEGRKAMTKACAEKLVGMMTTSIARETWSARGGPGTIHYDAEKMSLVVNQTQDVQEQVMERLQALQRLQDEAYKEYTMQIRVRSRKGVEMTMPRITFVREQPISLSIQTEQVAPAVSRSILGDGMNVEAKLYNDLTLALTFRECKTEQNDNERAIVKTTGHHLLQKLEQGKPLQLVLERNRQGRPERWLEISVREVPQETASE